MRTKEKEILPGIHIADLENLRQMILPVSCVRPNCSGTVVLQRETDRNDVRYYVECTLCGLKSKNCSEPWITNRNEAISQAVNAAILSWTTGK